MTTDPLESGTTAKELDLVEVEPAVLASVVGPPVDQLPEPLFESDQEVRELISWVRATRNEAHG